MMFETPTKVSEASGSLAPPVHSTSDVLSGPSAAVQAPALSNQKRKADTVSAAVTTPAKKAKGKAKDILVKEATSTGPSALLARVPKWKDLPDWKGMTVCPLLTMPGEVLDKCFNPDQNLHARDWIALAGVNRFFRERLDHQVFEEIWVDNEETNYKSHTRPQGLPAWHILTREPTLPAPIPPRPATKTKPAKLPFRPPPGPRENWTRAQYALYKEARRHYSILEKKGRADRAEKAALKALSDAAKVVKPSRKLRVGRTDRTVYMMVAGRREGEPAVKKDAWGRSVGEKGATEALKAEKHKERVARVKARAKARKDEAEATGFDMYGESAPDWAREVEGEEWVVPDTDGEDDLGPEEEVEFDQVGNEVVGRWKNESRSQLAAQINDTWINQTNAIKEYDVTRAELLGLRHALIANPRNSKQPQQMFLKAAVGSLALRSHGGMAGHMVHAENKASISQKRAANKKAKAIAEGKPVPAKKPKTRFPTAEESKAYRAMADYDFGYDDDYYEDDDDDFGRGGCEDCMELWVHGVGPPGGRCDHAGGSGS